MACHHGWNAPCWSDIVPWGRSCPKGFSPHQVRPASQRQPSQNSKSLPRLQGSTDDRTWRSAAKATRTPCVPERLQRWGVAVHFVQDPGASQRSEMRISWVLWFANEAVEDRWRFWGLSGSRSRSLGRDLHLLVHQMPWLFCHYIPQHWDQGIGTACRPWDRQVRQKARAHNVTFSLKKGGTPFTIVDATLYDIVSHNITYNIILISFNRVPKAT